MQNRPCEDSIDNQSTIRAGHSDISRRELLQVPLRSLRVQYPVVLWLRHLRISIHQITLEIQR